MPTTYWITKISQYIAKVILFSEQEIISEILLLKAAQLWTSMTALYMVLMLYEIGWSLLMSYKNTKNVRVN